MSAKVSHKLGIKLIANQGEVSLQAQNDLMGLLARKAITSHEDEIQISLIRKLRLMAAVVISRWTQTRFSRVRRGDYLVKSASFDKVDADNQNDSLPTLSNCIDLSFNFNEQYHFFDEDGKMY